MKGTINIIIGRLKTAAAVLLLVCILLPLSSCSKYVDREGNPVHLSADTGEMPAGAQQVKGYKYVKDFFEVKSLGAWLLVLSFLWPVVVLFYQQRSRRGRVRAIVWGIEPALAAGSCWVIYEFASMGTLETGAYVAFIANGSYAALWLCELIGKVKARGKEAV
jgi:hypothetical protein